MSVTIRIEKNILRRIKACAKKEKRSLKAVLELAVVHYLQKRVLEE